MRNLSILGSTGSIGTQTLKVVRENPGDFKVRGLSCGSNIDLFFEQIREFEPEAAAIGDESLAPELLKRIKDAGLKTEIFCGEGSNSVISTLDSADTVVGAMVGVSGLLPTYDAIMKGKDIALANKETLVAGGDVIMPLVKEKGVELLPVDSEHCAIWQCLWGEKKENLDRILITASGGPFRGKSREDLAQVTVESALNHPTWKMGGKITIDSSTMMNKGLEVIEASHLFAVDVDHIDVVCHPQSIIHSMIRMKDGSVLAQMGKPSMVLPIMVALYYPERGQRLVEEFDPFNPPVNNMTFEKIDREVFTLLDLAYEAGRVKGHVPTVMNAANEEAVWAFLAGKISYLSIFDTVIKTVEAYNDTERDVTIGSILDADKEARCKAKEIMGNVR